MRQLPQAQQQHVEVIQHVVINGGEVAEPAIKRLPSEDDLAETPPASTPPHDSPPLDDRHDPDSSFEFAPPSCGTFEQHELEILTDSEPAPPVPGPLDQHGTKTSV